MAWDGQERRQGQRFCEGHIEFAKDIAGVKEKVLEIDKRINGSIDDIHQHIVESNKYRSMIDRHDVEIKAIKGTKALIVTTLVTVLLMAGGVIWGAGKYSRQIEVNTKRLDIVEDIQRQK